MDGDPEAVHVLVSTGPEAGVLADRSVGFDESVWRPASGASPRTSRRTWRGPETGGVHAGRIQAEAQEIVAAAVARAGV
ncbi:MAG: hypothetical protein AAF845_09995 [Bacteroidota bacterium]